MKPLSSLSDRKSLKKIVEEIIENWNSSLISFVLKRGKIILHKRNECTDSFFETNCMLLKQPSNGGPYKAIMIV